MTNPRKRAASIAAGKGDPDAPAHPADRPPAPALDAEGKLAEWPPARTLYEGDRYDAPRPHWLALGNALGRMPYSAGVGQPLRVGMTVDEAFAALTSYVDRLADTLRLTVKREEQSAAELARFYRMLDAELDREELLAERRQVRAAARVYDAKVDATRGGQ